MREDAWVQGGEGGLWILNLNFYSTSISSYLDPNCKLNSADR